MKSSSKFAVIPFCFLVVACASSVELRDDATSYHYNGEKYSKVELTVSKDAADDLEDIIRFDPEQLRSQIERNLEVRGLLDGNSANIVRIEINDVRIRSSISAVMFGIMAGTDNVGGDVSLIGGNSLPLHTFHVSATYGFGGLMGFKETRMGWIYDEFAELTLKEILGLREEPSTSE